MQTGETGKVRAEYRTDALLGQHMHLHVGGPRRFGEHQQGIQPRAPRVQVTLTGGQVQAQLRQVRLEPAQARDEPARQQAARTAEHERRIGTALAQLGTNATQAIEGVKTRIAQAKPCICEFNATPVLDEQAHAQVLFQHLQLSAHRTVGDMQLFGRLADAVEPGSGFEGPKGIERWQVLAHDV